jgi:sugar lactone lactonase YvrE
VSNLTFGGSEGRTLFYTSRAGLFAVPMNVRGGDDPFSVTIKNNVRE